MRNVFLVLGLSVALFAASRQVNTQQRASTQTPSVQLIPNEIPTGPGDSVMFMSAAELQKLIKARPAGDIEIKSTNAGTHIVDVWREFRAKDSVARATNDTVHTDITEIYYVIEGSGMLMTGAKMINPLYRPAVIQEGGSGSLFIPSFSGKSQGGNVRHVGVGDVVVIPPWVVHQWRSLETPTMTYLNIRIDPEHRQPPKYINPALQK